MLIQWNLWAVIGQAKADRGSHGHSLNPGQKKQSSSLTSIAKAVVMCLLALWSAQGRLCQPRWTRSDTGVAFSKAFLRSAVCCSKHSTDPGSHCSSTDHCLPWRAACLARVVVPLPAGLPFLLGLSSVGQGQSMTLGPYVEAKPMQTSPSRLCLKHAHVWQLAVGGSQPQTQARITAPPLC